MINAGGVIHCNFCGKRNLGMNTRQFIGASLAICEHCIPAVTIGEFKNRLRHWPEPIINDNLNYFYGTNRFKNEGISGD